MYHVIQILLHRPFVSYGHLQSVLPEVALDSFSTCAAAANCIAQYLESYDRVHSFRFAPFFLFYASYVCATIHVRIAAQRHVNTDAFTCLRICLSVFDQNEDNNPAVKKAKAVILKLMDRMGVKPPDETTSREMPSSVPTLGDPWVLPSTSSHKENTLDNKTFASLGAPATTPNPDLLQGWNINDLDFDAILQSFGRPSPGVLDPTITNSNLVGSPTMMMNQNMPWSDPRTGHLAFQHPYNYMNQFGGGSMDDSLFGFYVSSKEDEW